MADDSDLTITVANDTSDTILDSLKDVAETMVLAVIISMLIIFLFFGDYKASLIVGSSIPTSILMSLIAITMAGFSLNVITMSALVLGVGMMVDNSIVVLESCFRATAEQEDKGAWLFFSSASRNRHCHQLDHRFDDHDLCRIPAAGILKRYDRTDVQTAGIHDRVLYVGVPAFCDDGGSTVLSVLQTERGEARPDGTSD